MDWYLEAGQPTAVSRLRGQIRDYLGRHAAAGSDLDAATLVASELVTNAITHGGGDCWVQLEWTSPEPRLTVFDLGPGIEVDISLPDDPIGGGRGLWIVSHLAKELSARSRAAGGSAVSVRLPVRRRPEQSADWTDADASYALPSPAEADHAGMFGRESFLRAIVVHLAQSVEHESGPAVAESSVAYVGSMVGARMEEAYRLARGLTGRMTSGELADLFVRLKHAIDGGFYVISADETKIVLGNDRCPFGETVRRMPSLCRMTSSVFGGIAARNRGEASVHLEERIAVGDAQCRVTVWLGQSPPDAVRFTHRYVSS